MVTLFAGNGGSTVFWLLMLFSSFHSSGFCTWVPESCITRPYHGNSLLVRVLFPYRFSFTGLLNVHTPNRGENQSLIIDTPAFHRLLTMEMHHIIAKNAPTKFPTFCLALSVQLLRMIKGRSTGKAFWLVEGLCFSYFASLFPIPWFVSCACQLPVFWLQFII